MNQNPIRKTKNNRLTAMMQVHNEADRFLLQVLKELSEFVDEIVILDDASQDGTVEICKTFPKVKTLVTLDESKFHREWELRALLWKIACSTNPDWLLSIDADEFYEDKAKSSMRELIDQDQFDWVGFRFFDFWGDTRHYRDDAYWQIHRRHTRTLVRYIPAFHYFYPQMDHHVPRLPLTYNVLPGYLAELKVKHFGWAIPKEERYLKYLRYKEIDQRGEWGSLAQYESILDENPNLVEWKEEE